jgi:ubiquitin-activating enzyme E1
MQPLLSCYLPPAPSSSDEQAANASEREIAGVTTFFTRVPRSNNTTHYFVFCVVRMSSLDEDLHSRQIWTYGLDAMQKMALTTVAVVGMNGLGAEVAKNLILANMMRVLLVDDCTATMSDLSSHFYLSELDIGCNRAHACRNRLQQLNPAVTVTSHDVAYSALAALLTTCTAVVLCDVPLFEAEKLNVFCREHSPPVRFVMAQTCGLCFRVFSDFGSQFTYTSVDTPYSVGARASFS